MHKRALLAAVVCAGLSRPALAQQTETETGVRASLDMDYVDFNRRTDADQPVGAVSDDGDGFHFRGQLGFGEHFHVFLDFTRADYENGFDINYTGVGVGTSWALNSRMDLIGRAAYLSGQSDVDASSLGIDGSGALLEAALLSRVTERFELETGVRQVDVDSISHETSARVIGRYFFTRAWAFTVGGTASEEEISWSAGFRGDFSL